MVSIVQRTERLSLQDAVDFVGVLCMRSLDRFRALMVEIPTFDHGGQIDHDVAVYAHGLQDWIVGSLHWGFQTERYFGEHGHIIQKTHIIALHLKYA